MERWNPKAELSRQEQILIKRATRTKKLFVFLREHRHELFDDGFQAELESMYRDTGAGLEPKPPAMMAMALLVQAYTGTSDAEAVDLTVFDLRWQLVLGCLGAQEPLFSQGALQGFRERMIRTGMDVRLLERTVELARSTRAFDPKKLPKHLRVAIDSAPLEGAGRVEDTVNLIAHAARKVVECVAHLLEREFEEVCREAGIHLLLGTSVKKALDVEWSDPKQKAEALQRLVRQVSALQRWVAKHLPGEIKEPPLREQVETLQQVLDQDLEPDPDGGGTRIREGVAEDRRVSIEDAEMRHGRKSRSKRFNGFKRHLAADLDTDLILAAAITPGNRPEEEALPSIEQDLARLGRPVGELHIDRAYINSAMVDSVLGTGGTIRCKPWVPRNAHPGVFTKRAFKIDVRSMTITCPAGEDESFRPGQVVGFDPEACEHCSLRDQCTLAEPGSGRTVTMAVDELLQVRLRKEIATPQGRDRLRERVAIEHHLAHLVRRQGRRARFRGVRKNVFDLRRAASIQNLETIQRRLVAMELADHAEAA
jgi:hypothetical protein